MPELTDIIPYTPKSAAAQASLDFYEDTDNGSHKITLAPPASIASDKTLTLPDETGTIATQEHVTSRLAGIAWKQPVRVATTVAGTLASSFENGDTVDGVVLATGDRILIKDQAAPAENGIYVVAASGAPARSPDADSGAELVNASCYVSEGTANADKQFVCTNNATPTLGSTNITFAVFSTGSSVDDTAYNATTWNGETATAPSKNAVRDQIETMLAAGGIVRSVVTSGGNFTAGSSASTDYDYFLAGAHTPTMPTAVGNTNTYRFKNNHTASIAFAVTSSQTIDGFAGTEFYILPGEEIVIRSDGANWVTSVARRWRKVILGGSGTTYTSNSTLANDPVLQAPVAANGIYRIRLYVGFFASAAGDYQFALTGPPLATLRAIKYSYATGAGTMTTTHSAGYITATSILGTSSLQGFVEINGIIKISGSGGTFAYQAAQGTSDPSSSFTIEASTLEIMRIG